MASIVEICNLALTSFGEARTIQSIDETSEHARQCKLHIPHARRGLLSGAYDWGFARQRVALVLKSVNDMDDVWSFAYKWPSDALKFNGFDGYGQDVQPPFLRANGSLYCDVQDAKVWIVADVDDPAQFNQPFVDALAAALAARIVFPLTRDQAMRKDAFQLAAQARATAEAEDANNDSNMVSTSSYNDARQ